jgi:hypothetical protein
VRLWRVVFAAAAWLYLAGIVVQVFLAGAGLFELTDWTLHAGLGWGLGSAPVLLLVLAFAARLERRAVWLTLGLTVAALLQPELAAARRDAPVVAAFHPVNALLVFWLAWLVARRSTGQLREVDRRVVAGTADSTGAPPATGEA